MTLRRRWVVMPATPYDILPNGVTYHEGLHVVLCRGTGALLFAGSLVNCKQAAKEANRD